MSKEKNKRKELSSGLILEIDKDFNNLVLKDKNSTFKIFIDYLKKVNIVYKKINQAKTIYIISKTYFTYFYKDLKRNEIKYKLNILNIP